MLDGSSKVYTLTRLEESTHSGKNDLAHGLRPLLIFGKFIGVVPHGGVASGVTEKLSFRGWSIGSIWNIICCLLMTLNSTWGAIGFVKSNERGALAMAKNLMYFILYLVSVFNYLFLLVKAKDLIKCLKQWKSMKLHFHVEDTHLWRDMNLAVVLMYTSIMLENASWHVKHALKGMEDADSNTNGILTPFEGFFIRAWPLIYNVIGYHPIFLGLIFITNKLTLYAREFGDIFLIVISRAIYYKFKLLIQEVERKLASNSEAKSSDKIWTQLVEDFNVLLSMLTSFQKFLSPLIFLSFSNNIYYLSMRFCVALQEQENLTIFDTVWANWAFLHGITRSFLVALSASKISEHAQSILPILYICPQEHYTFEIQRLQTILQHTEIGLSGFGCFTVTKSFMLKFLGVIFTVVIFLFQSAPATS